MARRKEENEKKMVHKPMVKKTASVNRRAVKDANAASKPERAAAKGGCINDGKCCRCMFRRDFKCGNGKSPHNGKYVPRKCGCENFKRK